MAITSLKCPNCAADIQVDGDREYGFCSYCGAQVKTRDVVEIRYTGQIQVDDTVSMEKQIEDGLAYIKMEDFYKAEKVFFGVIKDYPGRPEGYEMLIMTITRNYQIFIRENMDRVMKMADKMLAVASDERREYYESLYNRLQFSYSQGLVQQQIDNNLVKISKYNKMLKENRIILIIALALVVVTNIFRPGEGVMTVFLCVIAVFAALSMIGCKLSKNNLLRKNKKLDEAMNQQ